MGYYTGLMAKDWKVSMKGQLQSYLFLLIVWMFGVAVSFRLSEPLVATSISLTLIVLHIAYIATDIFINFGREQKLKLWLHNPNPSYGLLSSKLVISILNCLLSLSFAIGLYAIACILFGESFLQGKSLSEALALVWSVLGVGLYLGVWAIFIWSQYAAAKGKRFGLLRFAPIGFIAYFIVEFHKGFMMSTLYERMKTIGSFPAVSIGTKIKYETEEYQEFSMGVSITEFSFALVILFLLVSLLVFFLSARNVKKMEI
ncbi:MULTISPECIES: hypothetical protein [unclassified Sutcliffiella]|uniref:hypothetical protein n=1 Tax=unclassified Sutcliffiella TaxID=2837532 RepID=UPI0030D30FA7